MDDFRQMLTTMTPEPRRCAERFCMCENEISRQILDAAIAVHKEFAAQKPLATKLTKAIFLACLYVCGKIEKLEVWYN